MLNFYKKLSLVILSGAMTLGFSSIAQAEPVFTNWKLAKKMDCPMTCKAREMYVMMGGIDHKDGKPLSICATRKGKKGEWLVGYNRWEEKTCTVSIKGKEFRGEKYLCLCTTHMLQPLR